MTIALDDRPRRGRPPARNDAAKLIVSAERRLAAISKEVRVRVETS